MIDDTPIPADPTTRREAVVWIAAAVAMIAARFAVRQLTARRPVWAVLAIALAVAAGAWAWRADTVTVGAEHVNAASADNQKASGAAPHADPLLQDGYADPTAGEDDRAANDDPMAPLVPDAPASDYTAPGGPDDGTPPTWLPDGLAPWWGDIVAAAHENGLDSHAWAAIVAIECPWGDPACGSQAGAKGLAQIIDGTAATIEAASGLPCTSQPYDGPTSLRCGAHYFAGLLRDNADLWTPGDELPALLAAAVSYNAGPGAQPRRAVRDAARVGGDLCAGVAFSETQSYCVRYRDSWQETIAERGRGGASGGGQEVMARP